MDETEKDRLIRKEVCKNFAKQSYRTLLVAYRDFDLHDWNELKSKNNNFNTEQDKDCVETELVMAGIFALMDPLRDGIKEAIKTCHKAGITVRMCTGDSLDTATAISLEAGIVTEEELKNDTTGYICMEGEQFREAI